MKPSVSEKLQGLGLDVEFLAWLEGEEQRLPDLGQVRKVQDGDFAAAIRATEWLAQYFSEPELISPHTPDAWLTRYELLDQFLHGALKSSLFFRAISAAEDLDALERVLGTLLPPTFWVEYRDDIRQLRKHGLPLELPKTKAKPAGGTKPSEQTTRMRTALKYVSGASKRPYGDLAQFWNERLGKEKYYPHEIRGRLRRGDPWSKGEGAVERSLEFWQRVYQGDLRGAFPGPFPLSPKLKELNKRDGRNDQ